MDDFRLEFHIEKSSFKFGKSPHLIMLTACERKLPVISLFLSYSAVKHWDYFIRENDTPIGLEAVPNPSFLNLFCFPEKFSNRLEYYIKDAIFRCNITTISSFLEVFSLEWITSPQKYYEDLFKNIRLKYLPQDKMQKPLQKPIIPLINNTIDFKYRGTNLRFYKYGSIGSGSFGHVELVGIEPNNKPAAKFCIKFFWFPNDLQIRAESLEQHRNEISSLSQLSHKNIVTFLEVLMKKDSEKIQSLGLLMQYCNQGNLEEYISLHGPLNEDSALDFFSQLLEGMQYLHGQNQNRWKKKSLAYLHGDLKPKNILLHKSNEHPNRLIIKIADFGCAKKILKGIVFNKTIGTRCYMSPQILRGEEYTDKCDIWSLGIVLYYMLMGQVPWGWPEETVTSHQINSILKANNDNMDPIIEKEFQKRSGNLVSLLKKMLKINEIDRIDWEHLQKENNFPLRQHLENTLSHCNNYVESYKISCKNLLSEQNTNSKKISLVGGLQMIEEFEQSQKQQRVFDNLAVTTESFEEDKEEEVKKSFELKSENHKNNNESDFEDFSGRWDCLNEDSTFEDSKELTLLQLNQNLSDWGEQYERIVEIINLLEKNNELVRLELSFLEKFQFLLRKLANIFILCCVHELDKKKELFIKTPDLMKLRRKYMEILEKAKREGDTMKIALKARISSIMKNEHLYRTTEFLKYTDERFVEELLSDCVKNRELFSVELLENFNELMKKTRERIVEAKNNLDVRGDLYGKESKAQDIRNMLYLYEKLIKIMSFGNQDEPGGEVEKLSLHERIVRLDLVE